MKARRAYRTLKGIIRLQALIRGHLVRRQAASTLLGVQGIVKFQALIRGQLVRQSDIGVAVHKIHQVNSDYLFNIIVLELIVDAFRLEQTAKLYFIFFTPNLYMN